MQKFTIRDIENMCDIKAHTLRIWEQRYNLVAPKRKESTHRFYDENDLKKMLQIAYLYHSGWKISKIASLGEAGIEAFVNNHNLPLPNHAVSIIQLVNAAIDFDDKRFNRVIDEVISNEGLEACIIQVAFPFLQRIGLLWITNNIIPAQEHFSTYLIQHRIIAATESLSPNIHPKGDIVLYTPDGEHHELPLLFLCYMLKKHGWRTLYFGSNVKWQHLETVIQKASVTAVYLHMVTNFTRFDIDDYFEELCKAFPAKRIVASGTAIHAAQRNFTNLELLKTNASIYKFLALGPTLAVRKS